MNYPAETREQMLALICKHVAALDDAGVARVLATMREHCEWRSSIEISAAFESASQYENTHSYWNTDADFWVDLNEPPRSPILAVALRAIERKYQSELFRLHLIW